MTTRGALQMHGVLKSNLHTVIHGINEHLGSTLAACGDINRNVMATPFPLNRPDYRAARDALLGSADSSLTGAYDSMSVPPLLLPGNIPGFGIMLVSPYGECEFSNLGHDNRGTICLPIDQTIIQVAAGKQTAQFRTIYDSKGDALRELIVPIPSGTGLTGYDGQTAQLDGPVALVLVESFQGIEDRLRSLGTSWADSDEPSTGCSRRSRGPRTRSASSSWMPATSFERRSRACAPTHRCSAASTSSTPRTSPSSPTTW